MLWEESVHNHGLAKVSVDVPLLVLLVGTLSLDRLGGWHASDGRHVGVDVVVVECLDGGVKFDNGVSSVGRRRIRQVAFCLL
jgi:hypothetical protein